jgi:hypothetical protein
MSQSVTVVVDSAKGTARMSAPLVLGNTYDLSFDGVADESAEVVVLGLPQIAGEWEQADNPTPHVAARSDGARQLAMTTKELVEAFRWARPHAPHPFPPADPRKPVPLPGALLHGAAHPHGAVCLHFYVIGDGTTLAQGDLTLLWAPFEYDGDGNPVILQGPKGDKGEQGPQGPQGERGADAVIATSTGCVTFRVDQDPESPTYGHLFAYADNDFELYHDGNHLTPHWWLGTGSGPNDLAGHLYYTYYPADPDTAPTVCDLGSVIGPIDRTALDFLATLKDKMEASQVTTPAHNVNTGLALANAIWEALIETASRYAALALACLLPLLAFLLPGEAAAVETLGEMDPTNTVYTSQEVDQAIEDSGGGFPLKADADFAAFNATNVGGIQFAGSTNLLAYGDGTLLYGGEPVVGVADLEAGRNIVITTNQQTDVPIIALADNPTFLGNVTIVGDFSVGRTQYVNTVIHSNKTINAGTNYVATEMHTTNHVALYVTVVTNIVSTNTVHTVVEIGGNADYSRAASVLTPSFTIDNADTNLPPVLTGTGTWNLTGATVSLGMNAVTSLNGLSGAVTLVPSNNISFTTNGSSIAISASGSAERAWTTLYDSDGTAKTPTGEEPIKITTHTNDARVAWTNAETIGGRSVKVLSIGIGSVVAGVATPCIETPDGRQWVAQGRYAASGVPTHVWVPLVSGDAATLRIGMPDGRIFEMVGKYADAESNIVTHAWTEVLE